VNSEFFIPASPGHIPSAEGYFGPFGGTFIPEALVAATGEVAAEYEKAKADPAFVARLEELLAHYAGRPDSPPRLAARGCSSSART
jgi:tryptophan synthase beta chain